MPHLSSEPKSNLDWLDLNLPVPDEPLPVRHELPLAWAHQLIVEKWAETTYDEAYFARSLAGKNSEPFVL